MSKTIKLLTLCGTGGATSSVVATKVREILEEEGYKVIANTAKVIEAKSSFESFKPDIVVASTKANIDGVNIINGMPFLTGVGVAKVKEEILEELKKVNQKQTKSKSKINQK